MSNQFKRKPIKAPVKPAWFGFGMDPVNNRLIGITVSPTKEEAERYRRERLAKDIPLLEDVYSWRVFNLTDRDEVRCMRQWLKDCKLSNESIRNVAIQIREALQRMEKGENL